MLIREIARYDPDELRLVVARCMTTVLETIPEFGGSADAARRILTNFTFDQMHTMISDDLDDPTKRIVVAEANGEIVAQALYSAKTDSEDVLYGFCFSAFVASEYRQQGIATLLLHDALSWFLGMGVVYVVAQTHATNTAAHSLLTNAGFVADGPFDGNWPHFVLRKSMSAT